MLPAGKAMAKNEWERMEWTIINSSLYSTFSDERMIATSKAVVAKKRGIKRGCINCQTV